MDPDRFAGLAAALDDQVRRVIVGQTELVRDVLSCLFAEGHVLLEGVPGLGKTVLLLTQDADDIPFDLKHRQHVIYDGKSIETLRQDLRRRLTWAIQEATSRKSPLDAPAFSATLNGTELAHGLAQGLLPTIELAKQERLELPLAIRNDSLKTSSQFTHVYLFCETSSVFVPFEFVEQTVMRPQTSQDRDGRFRVEQVAFQADVPRLLQRHQAAPADAPEGLNEQYRLPNVVPSMPPGAVEQGKLRRELLQAPGKLGLPTPHLLLARRPFAIVLRKHCKQPAHDRHHGGHRRPSTRVPPGYQRDRIRQLRVAGGISSADDDGRAARVSHGYSCGGTATGTDSRRQEQATAAHSAAVDARRPRVVRCLQPAAARTSIRVRFPAILNLRPVRETIR